MRLHFQHYVGAAVAGAAVCAASGPALQAYGIPQMISSAILTISPRGDEILHQGLALKESQAQMVLVDCPAMFGESPLSNFVCGGESITAATSAALQPPDDAMSWGDEKVVFALEHKYSSSGSKYQTCKSDADSGCELSANLIDSYPSANAHAGVWEATDSPADDSMDQPKGSDDDCIIQNGECIGGHPEGFICGRAKCPDLTKYIFFCSDCGGRDDQGKCKGVRQSLVRVRYRRRANIANEQDPTEDPPNLWQGCECTEDPDWKSQMSALVRPGVGRHQAALQALPDISMAPSQPSTSSLPDASYERSN